MHREAFSYVELAVHQFDTPPLSVIELGSRNINGSIRALFPRALREGTYVGVDIAPGDDVDIVADAAEYEPLCLVDCVICCEVLEHAANAPSIVRNALRMLKDDGVFIMTCAGDGRKPHSAVDGQGVREGEFYRNVGQQQFLEWCEAAGATSARVTVDAKRGDLYAMVTK